MKLKRYLTVTAICLVLGFAAGCALARHPPKPRPRSYPITLQYDAAQVRIEPVEIAGKPYIRLLHPEVIGSTREVGRPALPQDEVIVVLPPDAANVRMTLRAGASTTVARGSRVEPLQPPRQTRTSQFPQDGSPLEPFSPEPPVVVDEAFYASGATYPPEVATLEAVTTLYGATVGVFRVSPFVFEPRQERTDLRTSLIGAVTFDSALSTQNLYPDLPDAQRKALLRRVINPGALASPASSTPVATLTSHADYVVPDVRPAQHDAVPYAVVTRAALAMSFQPLVEWKAQKGVDARLVTVEWIESRYPGVDLANKLRNFVLDARTRWNTSWILLGGDVEQVPARLGFYDSITSGYGPTDLFFSGLGTRWNADGDHVFGEGGEPDLDPDLFVGRASVQDAAQAAVFVGKVLGYEQGPPAGYAESALLMGVRDDLSTDSSQEYSIKPLLPSGFNVKRMYDPASPLAPDVIFNRANTIAQVNLGYHILSHMDHSGIQGMGTGSHSGGGAIDNNDVDALTNGLPGAVLWTHGCDPNAFDYDSISEHWMRNQSGGAVAFVGNTRTGWNGQTVQGQRFFKSWFTDKQRHLGTIFSTTQGSSFGQYYSCAMNLLGDPEMMVWNAEPTPLTLSGLGTLTTGPNALNLTVGGLAAGEEATVTFRGPGGQVYASGQTVGGALSGTLVAHTAAPLDLVVTSPDRLPIRTQVPVSASAGAHLYVAGVQVIDNLVNGGNNNQQLEPGEKALLRITLANGGGAASAAGTATLATSTAGVAISTPAQTLLAVAPAGTQSVDFPLVLGHAFSDGSALLFDLTTNGAGTEHTDVHVPLFAPVLEQTHVYDDSAGNGNGVPEAGETVEFGLHAINNGFGDTYAVTATLTADTGAVTVTDGQATLGNVLAKSDADSSDTFTLTVGGAFNPSVDTVTLTMTDSLGTTWSQSIELVVPAAPTGMTYRSTATSITPLWNAAAVADRNYKIYRSLAAGGPWAKIETFLVRDGALYEDATINPNQPSYFYRVAVIDPSGNESAPAQVQAWTSLPVLTGFPRSVLPADGAITGHTEAFDLDGDGQKEIFATTGGHESSNLGGLYAWDASGNQLIPGGDPNFAEFATLDGPNFGAPAFADIDNDGAIEIIVNGKYKVFAFEADGTPVAGWAGGFAIPNPNNCMPDPPNVHLTSPAVGDLDGDGWLEIITTAFDWTNYCDGSRGHVYVIDHAGALVATHHVAGGNYSYATPALADLDGNGDLEAVIPFSTGEIFKLDDATSGLSLITTVPGEIFRNEADLADLDGDGQLDIIAASQFGSSAQNGDRIFALHLDGTPVAGWAGGRALSPGDHVISQFSYSAGPAVADVDCDGKPEVALGTEQHVYLWENDGLLKTGWPVSRENKTGNAASAASPLIVDVNGDGRLDIVISSSSLADDGLIYAWDGTTGTPVNAFPQIIDDTISRTGTVADVDGDGLLEVVQGAGPHMYVFKTTGRAIDALLPWANVHRNAVHTSALLTADLGAACCTPLPAGALALAAGTGDGTAAFYPDETGAIYTCNPGFGHSNLNGIRFDPVGPLPAANFNCNTTLYIFDQAGTRRQALGVHAAPRNTCPCTFPPAPGGACFYEPLCTPQDTAHVTCSDLTSDSGVILVGSAPKRRITDFVLPNFPGLKVHLIQEAFADRLEQTYQFINTSATTYNLRLSRVADLDASYLDDGTATGTPVPSVGGYTHNIPAFVQFGAEVHDNVKTGSASTPVVRVGVTAPQGSDAVFEGARLQGDGGSSHGRVWWNYGVPPSELNVYAIDGNYWTTTWTGDPATAAESDQAITVQSLLTIPPGQTRTYVTHTFIQ